jgi:hypothetical protein
MPNQSVLLLALLALILILPLIHA